ncbi:MAG TPA: hypothetical protein VIJ42_09265 [Stellaceae bacterium]
MFFTSVECIAAEDDECGGILAGVKADMTTAGPLKDLHGADRGLRQWHAEGAPVQRAERIHGLRFGRERDPHAMRDKEAAPRDGIGNEERRYPTVERLCPADDGAVVRTAGRFRHAHETLGFGVPRGQRGRFIDVIG